MSFTFTDYIEYDWVPVPSPSSEASHVRRAFGARVSSKTSVLSHVARVNAAPHLTVDVIR
jgi:hypothetical protein